MPKNKKVILLVICAVAAVPAVLFILTRARREGPPAPPSPGAAASPAPLPTAASGNKVFIKTPTGDIAVNNFYQNPADMGSGEVVLERVPAYQIVYFTEGNSFLIVLQVKPLTASREAAEAAFLAHLGVTKDEACRLPVTLNVAFRTDEKLSRNDYRLSFCSKERLPF